MKSKKKPLHENWQSNYKCRTLCKPIEVNDCEYYINKLNIEGHHKKVEITETIKQHAHRY